MEVPLIEVKRKKFAAREKAPTGIRPGTRGGATEFTQVDSAISPVPSDKKRDQG